MDVSLVMFKADGSRRDFPVKGDRLVIGRKNTCDLRIPLSSVSRQHCEIRIDEGRIKVRDLGSSNGTYHNDTRVQETDVAAGDEVVVGPVVFTVVVDGEPAEIEPVRTVIGDASGTAAGPSEASHAGDAARVAEVEPQLRQFEPEPEPEVEAEPEVGLAASASEAGQKASGMNGRSHGSAAGKPEVQPQPVASKATPKPPSASKPVPPPPPVESDEDADDLADDDPIAALEAMAEAEDVDFDEIELVEEDER